MVEAVTDAMARRGRVVILEGQSGFGKTHLLGVARDAADDAGVRVLGVAGRAADRHAPLAGIGRLLVEGRHTDAPSTLAARRHVRGTALAVLDELAVDPLVLLVDDAQCLDPETLGVLHEVVGGRRGHTVTLLLGVDPSDIRPHPVIARLSTRPESRVVALAPLSEVELAHVVGSCSNLAPDAVVPMLRALELGDVRLACELVRWVDANDVDPAEVLSAERSLPATVRRIVQARLADLSPTARGVAQALTVLAEQADVRRLAALTGLTQVVVEATMAELVHTGLAVPDAHPRLAQLIVQLALYHEIPEAVRASLHARAAEVLDEDGMPSGPVAGHLLASPPAGQAWRVDALERAARRAEWEGELAAAARWLRRAVAEPPPRERRLELLVWLGRLQARLGSSAAGETLLDALDLATDPFVRASVLEELGKAQATRGDLWSAAHAFEVALTELDGRDPELANELRAHRGYVTILDVRIPGADDVPRGAPPATAAAQIHGAFRDLLACEDAETVGGRARRAGERLLSSSLGGADAIAACIAAAALTWTDDVDGSDALLDQLQRLHGVGPRTDALALVLHRRAINHLHRGRLQAAVDADREALRILSDRWAHYAVVMRATLALAHLDLGQCEQAAGVFEVRPTGSLPPSTMAVQYLYAAGRHALATGDTERAVRHFEDTGRLCCAGSLDNPAIAPWRTGQAEALRRDGRMDAAVELAQAELELVRRFGAPRPLARTLRTLGLLCGGSEGIQVVADAEALLAPTGFRLEQARTKAAKGRLLRVVGERAAARGVLLAAHEEAVAMGAGPLQREIATDLQVLGVARFAADDGAGALDALTPSEGRVAALAADGLTNREIATQLYVTIKAVEFHLSNVYTKLGIRSRRELPADLGTASQGAG